MQDVEELIQRPVMCTEKYHQNEALEYFCQDCKVCICMKCGFVNHNQNGNILVSDVKKGSIQVFQATKA